ncbi:hypothetical protein K469DRAFT_547146 [Zopfia rhizophila CBS 207.26]|uniref:UbiA prenyltransferase n=1 Tax=Zopfia rhizophila CBS 207.26 TaxID=1314779 RepID=A0A6A6ETP9_9PEZI|nr:hypothetical protein K469DRAFT_547146 [Zopfia rhizophila CBS 207.26]
MDILKRINFADRLPVWGFSFGVVNQSLDISPRSFGSLLISNWLYMTLIHATFCAWNDILDAHIDAFAARTAVRPLPSGRCSILTALIWFCVQFVIANIAIWNLLGPATYYSVVPIFALATLYPLAKRSLPWPQLALAPIVLWPVFVGWISASSRLDLTICGPLFLAYAAWTVYFDTA